MSTKASSPSGRSSENTARQRRCASSQTRITSPGSTTPISPLASTASALAHQTAKSQRRSTRDGSSSVRSRQASVTVISPATSMSWLAYCAPMK